MSERLLDERALHAIEAIESGNIELGLLALESHERLAHSPTLRSYLALCVAIDRGRMKEACGLCARALRQDPVDPAIYLNLGRILRIAGKKEHAIRVLRKGLKHGCVAKIRAEIEGMGIRRRLVFVSLGREHPVNRISGLLLSRLQLQ